LNDEPHIGDPAAAEPGRLLRLLAYSLSLPERLLRSSLVFAAGIFKELCERLVPGAIQDTQLFQAFIGRANRYVIEDMAKVEGVYAEDAEKPGSSFVARKTLSNVVEVGSLLTLHLSPVLVLAAASDVLKGGKTLLHRICNDLKEDGVIKGNPRIDNFEEFLDSLRLFTLDLARKAELPPLSREELRRIGADVQGHVAQLKKRNLLDLEQLNELADTLSQTGDEQKRSLWQTASAVAHGSAGALVTSARGIVSVGNSSLRLFDDQIIDFYQQQLQVMQAEGWGAYTLRVATPYYQAMGRSWQPGTYTWTEAFVHGLTRGVQ
jgi:hypothetical protein